MDINIEDNVQNKRSKKDIERLKSRKYLSEEPVKKEGFFTFPLAISLISLILSGYTYYRSTFYQYDNLYISTTQDRIAFDKPPNSKTVFRNKFNAIFVNKGNTNIAVIKVLNWLVIGGRLASSSSKCHDGHINYVEVRAVDFKPFVLKPGEATSIDLKFETDQDLSVYAKDNQGGNYMHEYLCSNLRMDVVALKNSDIVFPLSSSEYVVVPGVDVPSGNFWVRSPQQILEDRRFF